MAGPQLEPAPGAPIEAWLAYKASMHAAPAVRDGLTIGALVDWLTGDALLADVRDGLAGAARERVDALTLAALDAAGDDGAERLAGEWVAAATTARSLCRLIGGGGEAWRLAASQRDESDGETAPSADALAARLPWWGLRAMHALWEPQFWALGRDRALLHPVWPLADAWIDAFRPTAAHATGKTGIAPRMQTRWRGDELPTFEAPKGAAIVLDSDAPALARLPGMDPAQVAAELLPPFWWDLVHHAMADPVHYGVDPRRARTDALRVPRIALYVAGLPLVRQRVGVLRVNVATRDLVHALYPGDRERRVLRTDRLAPVQRSLEQLDAYSRRVDGGVLFPIRRARWQSADVIAGQGVAFDVTYPERGGNGPAYDRELMAAAGPNPRHFLAYLAATFAMRRGASVDLNDFARSVHAGLPPVTGRQRLSERRVGALDALDWLADWRPDGVQRVDFSHRRGVVRFSAPQRLLPD